jgi:hypothetical protein
MYNKTIGGDIIKRYKILAIVFIVFAVILSDIMCSHVAFEYSNMLWGIKYEGYSAPAEVAFLLTIPYIAGIILSIILSYIFLRKSRK